MMLDWPTTSYRDSYNHVSFAQLSYLEEYQIQIQQCLSELAILDVWFFPDPTGMLFSAFTGLESLLNRIDALTAERPPAELLPRLEMPPGVPAVEVSEVSGDIPGDDCQRIISTWFIPGVSPINRCRIHRRVSIDTRTGYRSDEAEGPYIRSEVREFWPTDLLEIFAQAGLPRLSPPPYPPEPVAAPGSAVSSGNASGNPDRAQRGFPPSIVSPLANTTYILREGDSRFNQLVLLASADQDSGELFWFANAQFLGRAKPDERFTWQPAPGLWDLTVVDSRGRSAGLRVNVIGQ
jgi:penicillin-binding protein 1C